VSSPSGYSEIANAQLDEIEYDESPELQALLSRAAASKTVLRASRRQ
jgi:hypothetical protein